MVFTPDRKWQEGRSSSLVVSLCTSLFQQWVETRGKKSERDLVDNSWHFCVLRKRCYPHLPLMQPIPPNSSLLIVHSAASLQLSTNEFNQLNFQRAINKSPVFTWTLWTGLKTCIVMCNHESSRRDIESCRLNASRHSRCVSTVLTIDCVTLVPS